MVGIGLPIRVPFVIVHYEVKAYFHQAINGDLSLTYVNGANEINIGKAITFGNIPLDFAPQLGIGFDNGITTKDKLFLGRAEGVGQSRRSSTWPA